MTDRIEPTPDQLRAVERVLTNRRGFRHAFDDLTYIDAPDWNPDEDEWHPIQHDLLYDLAIAALNGRPA